MRLFVIDYYQENTWGAWEIPEHARNNPGPLMFRYLPKFCHSGPMEVSNLVASWLLKIEADWEIIRSDGTVVVDKVERGVPKNSA